MRACVLLAAALGLVAAASSNLRADRAPATPLRVDQAGAPAARSASPVSQTPATPAVQGRALVQKYCLTCHNDRAKTGGLTLENLDPAEAGTPAETWEKAVRKLRGGMMPPLGMPRPDNATLDAFVTALEGTLDQQALRTPNPGHKPVHRLNRTEYGNAVRDILDLDVDVAELLPPDDEAN